MNKKIIIVLRGLTISILAVAIFFVAADYQFVSKKEAEAQSCVQLGRNTDILDTTQSGNTNTFEEQNLVNQGCVIRRDGSYTQNMWMVCPDHFYQAGVVDQITGHRDIVCCPLM